MAETEHDPGARALLAELEAWMRLRLRDGEPLRLTARRELTLRLFGPLRRRGAAHVFAVTVDGHKVTVVHSVMTPRDIVTCRGLKRAADFVMAPKDLSEPECEVYLSLRTGSPSFSHDAALTAARVSYLGADD